MYKLGAHVLEGVQQLDPLGDRTSCSRAAGRRREFPGTFGPVLDPLDIGEYEE